MSFLNPVSEPVLMYSSTDTSAPQINYAARAAGDVKTVLKACLVTGYGTKQGAGWTMQNETDFTAEFVSPSALLSDYRFGIDDTSTTTTTFYYTYQGTRTSPNQNSLAKSLSYVTTNSPKNTWTLLVTKQGMLWVEKFLHSSAQIESCRIIYWGRVKSALLDDMGKNISWYNFGFNGGVSSTSNFFSSSTYYHLAIKTYTSAILDGANLSLLKNLITTRNNLTLELTNSIFLSASDGYLLGEMMPILPTKLNDKSKLFGLNKVTFNGRPALYICIGVTTSDNNISTHERYCEGCYVYLDTWEY